MRSLGVNKEMQQSNPHTTKAERDIANSLGNMASKLLKDMGLR
jgi:hypothetical protein